MKQRFRIEVYVAVQLQRTVEMMATGWQKSLRQFSAENVVLTKEDLGPNAIKFSLEELLDLTFKKNLDARFLTHFHFKLVNSLMGQN